MKIKATAYDSNNNIIKCDECDKSAGYCVMGATYQIAKCKDHSPLKDVPEVQFIYNPPSSLKKSDVPVLLKESNIHTIKMGDS